jgi:hypothetical protein
VSPTEKQIDELVAVIFEDLDRWERDFVAPFSADEILSIRRVVKAEIKKWGKNGTSKMGVQSGV